MFVKSNWIEPSAVDTQVSILTDLSLSFLLQGGSIGHYLAYKLACGDVRFLVEYDVDYSLDWEVEQLFAVRQGLAFFQKCDWMDLGIDTSRNAITTFIETERVCGQMNNLFRSSVPASGGGSPPSVSLVPELVQILEGARKLIRGVLKVCPQVDKLEMRFGPGATTATRKTAACPMMKMSSGLQCSSALVASGLLPGVLRQIPHWSNEFTLPRVEDSVLHPYHDDLYRKLGKVVEWMDIDVGEGYWFSNIPEFAGLSGRDLYAIHRRCMRVRRHFQPGSDTYDRNYVDSKGYKRFLEWAVKNGVYISLETFIMEYSDHIDVVEVDVVPGNLVTVPKNAKTDRTIMIEPCLNSFFQQGIRSIMEKRMSVAGLSTRDQSLNQRAARTGSLIGSLATIDLSSASDLISYCLVQRLLPDDWFMLLSSARTGSVAYEDGSTSHLEKFSSMGNAFTFPLETLIFWAISKAAMLRDDSGHYDYCLTSKKDAIPPEHMADSSTLLVYGDDIIVPTRSYDCVTRALHLCGFKVNERKSYKMGRFRESCGSDYYKGFNVRPYYQKKQVTGETLFTMHNYFFRRGYYDVSERVLQYIPESLRIFGPDGYGDGHLLSDNWVPIRDPKLLRKGFNGVSFETFTRTGRTMTSIYPGDHISPLYSVYVSDRSQEHPLVPASNKLVPIEVSRDGRPKWPVPGSAGYKRSLIYTLC